MTDNIEDKFYFFANFFDNVSNGPAKFARLLHRLSRSNGNGTIVTEDLSESTDGVIDAGKLPFYVRSTWLAQRYRSARNLRIARGQQIDADTPLVFNNVMNAVGCACRLPNPTIGFINDYKNLPSERSRYNTAEKFARTLLAGQERRAAHVVDKVVVNSAYLRDRIIAAYGIPPEKIEVLYKGLEIPEHAPPIRTFSSDRPVELLFVKTDYKCGGLPDIIEALALLPDTGTYNLTVIGVTRSQYTDGMGAYTLPAHVSVRWLGRQSQSVVLETMGRTHIFCSPSYSEALGVANIEALLQRCRIVTTGVGGIPEVIDGEKYGEVVPPGNPTAIAEAIEALRKEDPVLAERRAHRAAMYVCDKFDIKHTYTRFLEVINSVHP